MCSQKDDTAALLLCYAVLQVVHLASFRHLRHQTHVPIVQRTTGAKVVLVQRPSQHHAGTVVSNTSASVTLVLQSNCSARHATCTCTLASTNLQCSPCPALCCQKVLLIRLVCTACSTALCCHAVSTVTTLAVKATACITKPGCGYRTDGTAAPCREGTYSSGNTQQPCVPCPSGLTTEHERAKSVSACMAPPGFFFQVSLQSSIAKGLFCVGQDATVAP